MSSDHQTISQYLISQDELIREAQCRMVDNLVKEEIHMEFTFDKRAGEWVIEGPEGTVRTRVESPNGQVLTAMWEEAHSRHPSSQK